MLRKSLYTRSLLYFNMEFGREEVNIKYIRNFVNENIPRNSPKRNNTMQTECSIKILN